MTDTRCFRFRPHDLWSKLPDARVVRAIGVSCLLSGLLACATSPSVDSGIDGKSGSEESELAEAIQTTTPEGKTFWYRSMPTSDRTAVAVSWASELPDETDIPPATAKVGIELMLNGGAGGLAPEKIIADFEDLDSGSRLWVQPQEISGFMLAPEVHMERAAEIANMVLTRPNLDEQWFDREKQKFIDDALSRQSVVFGLAWNLIREVSLDDHPYKRFWSLAPIQSVEAISLSDVKRWHRQAFLSNITTITAAGNASAEKIGLQIDRMFQGMETGESFPRRTFARPVSRVQTIVLHQPDAPKSAIVIVGNLPPHSAGLDIPIQLGIGVLGYGKQSRLFKAVRSGLRAAYGFSANQFSMTRAHKMFHMGGEVETAQLQAALNETRKAYEKFREEGVGVLEFPIARRFYRQEMKSELAKPESVAYLMLEARLNQQSPGYVRTLVNEVSSLERSEVNEVIKSGFPEFDSLIKVVVTPDADAIEDACVIRKIEDWVDCR